MTVGGHAFRASWRSGNGLKLAGLLVLGALLAVHAWLTATAWPLVPMAAAAAMAWWMGQEFRAGLGLLRIDGEGLGGYWVYGKTLRWADIDRVHTERMPRTGPVLVLTLREASPSLRLPVRSLVARRGVRWIPLGALKPSERTRAVAAAQQALADSRFPPP